MTTWKTAKTFAHRNRMGMAVVLALLGLGSGILFSGGSEGNWNNLRLSPARLISVEPLPQPVSEQPVEPSFPADL